jgi:hypothetical protein
MVAQVWLLRGDRLQTEFLQRLRVPNARCYEDVAIESAEFREL